MSEAISILIPTFNYNVVPLVTNIHEQVEALQIPYEILVFDDCSPTTDIENQAIAKLKNTIFKKLDKNIGRTAIRNLLAKSAQYNWLLFLDADVLPSQSNFIEKYIEAREAEDVDVIYGGVAYQNDPPPKNQYFRWYYGKKRESKSVLKRQEDPYSIISQNLMIQKKVFLDINTVHENYYGLDNLFSNQLKRRKSTVLHIDNPVLHWGLEDNLTYISKALKAVETTIIFEKYGQMDNDHRPLQKSYLTLKRWGLLTLFRVGIAPFKKMMERNFNSTHPNLFWFDLYRLHYYIQLKNKHRV